MTLRIELRPMWQLWPLVHWDWFYHGWAFCEHCINGHDLRRSITVLIQLPFAVLVVRPSFGFKTWVAINGCHSKRGEPVTAEPF